MESAPSSSKFFLHMVILYSFPYLALLLIYVRIFFFDSVSFAWVYPELAILQVEVSFLFD